MDEPVNDKNPAVAPSALSAALGVKKPRLFYWEDAEDVWAPADRLEVENLVDTTMMDNEEVIEIRFKRVDMTDDEFDNLPEC